MTDLEKSASELNNSIRDYDNQIISLLIEVDQIKERKREAEDKLKEIKFKNQLEFERKERIVFEQENQKLKERIKGLEEASKQLVNRMEMQSK